MSRLECEFATWSITLGLDIVNVLDSVMGQGQLSVTNTCAVSRFKSFSTRTHVGVYICTY